LREPCQLEFEALAGGFLLENTRSGLIGQPSLARVTSTG
jgi:hypothetical protein